MRRMMLVALPLLAALAACDGTAGGHPTPSWFASREPLVSCGAVTLPPGGDGAIPDDALACFARATAEGAELAVVRYSTEGDPFTVYYRRGPRIDGIDVVTDSTQDAFGPRGWTRESCPDAVSVADLGACLPVG